MVNPITKLRYKLGRGRYQLKRLSPTNKWEKVGEDYYKVVWPEELELGRGTWKLQTVTADGGFGKNVWGPVDIAGGGIYPGEEAVKKGKPLISVNQEKLDSMVGDIEALMSVKDIFASLREVILPEGYGAPQQSDIPSENIPPIDFKGTVPSYLHPYSLRAYDYLFEKFETTVGKTVANAISQIKSGGISPQQTGAPTTKSTASQLDDILTEE